jgi:hypothetical protein
METTGSLSDWLEAEELRAVHHVCPQATRSALGLGLVERGGALISFATNDPSILWNRALAHGAAQPATLEVVRRIIQEFQARGVRDYFIQLNRDALLATDADLEGLGLVKGRAWRRFERADAPAPEATTDLEVRRLLNPSPALSLAFGQLVASAFGLDQRAIPTFQAAAESDLWVSFMSFDGDEPAGTGALLVRRHPATHELLGWLDMGATAPVFRRRGGQQAVLSARLDAARELGCARVFTETGEAVPGDPQHSYRNIVRAGFVPTVVRENWRPKPLPPNASSG